MKKKWFNEEGPNRSLKKWLRVMKLTLFFLLAGLMHLSASVYSQQTKLSISLQNASVRDVLKTIEDQSEFSFLYKNDNIDVNRLVSIDIKNKSVEDLLDELFKGTKVTYEIFDRQIVLMDKEKANFSVQIQQQKLVSGKVTDSSGTPLPGVTVAVKGSANGAITDENGKYALTNITANTTLVFSFVGMKTQEILYSGQTILDVTMKEGSVIMDEVVVIGYGTAKKVDLTGSVARLQGEALKNQAITQISEAFAGTIAGFYSNQNTSAAGGSSLEVRGPTSLSAGTNPLIVLDGVIFNGGLSDINPSDIKSVDILKDASSAAVFGSKAASGVILITTNKGEIGKPTINFTTKTGISEITNKNFHPYQGVDYLNFRRDFFRTKHYPLPDYYWNNPNDLPQGVTLDMWRNASANPAADNSAEWTNRLNLFPTEIEMLSTGKSINWMDQVFQKGIQQDYDLSIGGGTKNVKYYWSIGYVNNVGITVGDKFSAIRSRLNFDFDVTDWLKVGINSQYALKDQSSVTANLNSLECMSPYSKMFNDDGTVKWYPNDYASAVNPLLNYYGQNRLYKLGNLFASMYAEFKLPFGFDYRVSFQSRISNAKDYNFWDTNTLTGASTYQGGYGTRQDYSESEWMVDNILKWNKEIGINKFDLTLLYNAEQDRSYTSQYSNQTYVPNDALGFHGMQFGTVPNETSNDTQSGGNALMARLNYTLLGKYLLTTSVRRDGYSAFGLQNPTAIFPAVALAWRISDENFFKIDLINRMKLRLSWGVNGNRDIGIYAALAQLGSNLYDNGSKVVMGTYTNSVSNPGLRWERTQSINAGLDIGLFKDRIDMTVDYYDMTTTDLLMNRQLPEITGYSSITANLGELGNHGFEMTLNTVNVKESKFNWRSSLVFSFNRNKIKKLFGDIGTYTLSGKEIAGEVPDYSNGWFPGQAIDVVWNYKTTGIWQLNEAAEAAVYKQKPGDVKALDVDGSGNYTSTGDKMFIGYERPRYRLGLKNEFDFLTNFTASIFIRADLGQIRRDPYITEDTSMFDRLNTFQRPYWTPTNNNSEWPALGALYNAFGGGIAIYKPASFVRIQDVSLAYSLPTALSKRIKINNMRIFASVRNLCVFTKWPGYDPESGNTPMPKTYTLGINLSL